MKFSFVLLLLATSLIVIGEVIWIITIYEVKTTLEDQILNDAKDTNSFLINQIDNYISGRMVDMINFVNDKSIIQAVESSNTEFQKMNDPRQYIEAQNVTWSSTPRDVITPIMNNIIENPTSDRLRHMMNIEKSIYHGDVFGRIIIANSYGADVAGSIKPDDYDQFTDPWYVKAKQNGEYIGDVTFDKASAYAAIPISVRMNDENGNFIGVSKGVITMKSTFKTISNQLMSTNTLPIEIELINTEGIILYSTDPSETPFKDSHDADFMQNINSNSGKFSYQSSDQKNPEWVVYSKSIASKITPSSNWIIITKYDPSQILKSVTSITDLMIIIMIIIIPTACVCISLIAARIEKPISIMTLATKEFSKGNITQIKVKGIDEMEELASSFNHMTELIKNSQNEIELSEKKYRQLFEHSPDPIRISSLDAITIDVNNAFIKKFGYTKEELIGKPIHVTIDDRSTQDIEEMISNLKKGKSYEAHEAWYKKKDGLVIPVLLNVSLWRDRNNNPIGYIATVTEITEIVESRRKLEAYDKKISTQLEKMNVVDKQKAEFSSMISHELTTPLFPIKFHAEMLKDPKLLGKLNNEQNKALDEILQNTTKLEKLIGDILDAQKIDMQTMKFVKETIEVDKFMENITNINMPLMVNKQIQLVNTTQGKFHLNSDPGRLEQVFSNLIVNSVDFVAEKTGIIEIGAENKNDDILFHVKDNGIGIPKEKQYNLFKKFYQIDTSATRKHRGSGLGLSICKGITEGLGGKIWLESTVDVGTIVYFIIPKKRNPITDNIIN